MEKNNVIILDIQKMDKDGQLAKDGAKRLAEEMSEKELKEWLKVDEEREMKTLNKLLKKNTLSESQRQELKIAKGNLKHQIKTIKMALRLKKRG
jgi:hypothetical protein